MSYFYEGELSLIAAAAELGFSPEQLRGRIGEAAPALKRTLAALLNEDGTVHREAFVAIFPLAVKEWGLGEYQAPTATGQPVTPSLPPDRPKASGEGYERSSQTDQVEPLSPVVFWGVVTGMVVATGVAVWLTRPKRTDQQSE
jgi:hypothetical protein